jgi:hypothetical protein
VALWRLDETSGNLSDAKGTHALSAVGTPGSVAGRISNGRSFNGTNQRFENTATSSSVAATMAGAVSVEAWVYVPAGVAGAYHHIVAYGANDFPAALATNHLLQMGVNASRQVYWYWESAALAGVTATSTAALAADTWTHVALTRTSGGTVKVYLNGALSQTWTGQTMPGGGTSSYWAVGGHPGFAGEFFQGNLDDIRVSKVARSDAEILATYTAGRRILTGSKGEAVTVTRASTRSCTNAAGSMWAVQANEACVADEKLYVEAAVTNLFTRSEEADNGGWTKSGTSVTANAVVAPDGAQGGDTVAAVGGPGSHYASLGVGSGVTNGATYTFSLYVKAGGSSRLFMYNNTATGNPQVRFDLSAGTATWVVATNGVDKGVESLANGWKRVWLTFTADSTAATMGLYVLDAANALTYTAAGESVYVWGAQLNTGTLARYVPTQGTAATSNADKPKVAWPAAANGTSWSLSADTCFSSSTSARTVLEVNPASDFRASLTHASATWTALSKSTTSVASAGVTVADAAAGACRHVVLGWDNSAGVLTTTVKLADGTTTVGTASNGAVTGGLSDAAWLYLGDDARASVNYLNGSLANVCVGNAGVCQ